MPWISGGGGGGLGAVTLTGAPSSGQVIVASSATAAAWSDPIGKEYDYVQITANVTTASNADAIIGNAVTYDGATRIKIEVYAPLLFALTNATSAVLRLMEGATDLGQMATVYANTSATVTEIDAPCYGCRFLTPTAAAHTYKINLVRDVGAGTAGVAAGAGGAGVHMPAWYRITKA